MVSRVWRQSSRQLLDVSTFCRPFSSLHRFLSLLLCVHRTCVNTHLDVTDRLYEAGENTEEERKKR